MRQYETTHLVKTEDLNHHGTLFAARAAGWFVEAGFVAAGCTCGTSEDIVCRNLHTMSFRKPVKSGTLLRFLARVASVGRSSFLIVIRAVDAIDAEIYIEGAITFVATDGMGKGREHGIVLDEPADEEERAQRALAERIGRQREQKT